MITLKRLQVHNFKGLRDVDLLFPEQGNLLIEGHNEAGKSTLFEAVYVALYGKPLVGEDERARQEEVIQHGQPKATVELTLNIGEQTLTVSRVFERGRTQHAVLTIQQPGMQPETVNRARTVDARILKELGNLDGESMRNSCFVEQKELGRIEALSRIEREQAIHKLLGLERLTQMMDEFKWRAEQKSELAEAEKLLDLAHLQEQVRTLALEEESLAERFDAIKVASYLKTLTSLADQKDVQEQHLQELTIRIQQAQDCLDRCLALHEQITRCDQMTHTLADVATTRSEVNRLQHELEQLAYKEQVELPEARASLQKVAHVAEEVALVTQMRTSVREATESLHKAQRLLETLQQAEADQEQKAADVVRARARSEQREDEAGKEQHRLEEKLTELVAKQRHLEQAFDLVTQWELARQQLSLIQQEITETTVRQRNIHELQIDLQRQEQTVRDCAAAVEQAEREQAQTSETVRLATASEELNAWVRLKGVERALSGYADHQQTLLASKQAAEIALATERNKARMPLVISLVLTIACVLALLAGLFWLPAFVPGACFAGGAIASWVWLSRANRSVKQRASERDHYGTELQHLDVQRQAALQTGGNPVALQSHEQQIRQAGLEIPTSLEAGRAVLADLLQRPGITNVHQARAVEQHARDHAVRLREQLKHEQKVVDERRRALASAQADGDPAAQLNTLAAQTAEQEKVVTLAEQRAAQAMQEDGSWPTRSQDVRAALAACQAEQQATAEAQKRQAEEAARLRAEAQADLEQVQRLLRQAQDHVQQQREADPAAQVERSQMLLSTAQTEANQQEAVVQQLLADLHLDTAARVEAERGFAEARIQTIERDLATRSTCETAYQEQAQALRQKRATTATSLQDFYQAAQTIGLTNIPSFAAEAGRNDDTLPLEVSWSATLDQFEAALHSTLVEIDEAEAQRQRDAALSEQGGVKREIARLASEKQEQEQYITALFIRRQVSAPFDVIPEVVKAAWPPVARVAAEDKEQVEQELEEMRRRLYATRQQEQTLAEACGQPVTPLSIDECQHKVDELRENRDICAKARMFLQEARDRIARHVLPITERNMQPLLQQLTSGRYRDVRLTPEERDGRPGEMDYRIRVWDPAAGRFVAKNLFSGGTRDQCSLALRLAFALATLPQELGVAPGFIFLDEPLSAFDAQRAQALVELLTTGTIAQQFSQVVLISHYHAFDREAFRYHVRMEAGQIIESDLPTAEAVDVLLPARLA